MNNNFYLVRAASNLMMGMNELEKNKENLPPELYELLKDMFFDAADRWGELKELADDQ